MASYREIVTKTVLGKGKKLFTNHYSLTPETVPTTILGCWVINHKFEGFKDNNKIKVKGTSDVNIWYSCENDTKTEVAKHSISYEELLNVNRKNKADISNNEEIIVRSLKEPVCTKVEIKDGKIEYDIEKELGIEIVGDSKVKVAVNEDEDDWEIIQDEESKDIDKDEVIENIDNEVKENFIDEG